MNLRPFRIAIPQGDIADLHHRLDRTRWPDEINDESWGWGTPLPWLQELVHHWRHEYDWRAHEARLNALPQFMATIDGQDIHFIHIKGEGENPFPLLLIHGWPGSVVEFEKIIPQLTHGPNACSLVIPSLPGFGFSARPTGRGMTPVAIGRLFAKLMAGLGYERYGAQGGDWGSAIATAVAQAAPANVAGIHLNLIIRLLAAPPTNGLSEAEQRYLKDLDAWTSAEGGYSHIQGTRPQTLGYALTDSPTGLAAWITEKFRVWTDCHGDPLNILTKDELLTNISLYWFTGAITSSLRIYKERALSTPQFAPGERLATPMGHARFPKEIFLPPREWAERLYNVTHWTEMPKGGHFAAMEQPTLLAQDIQTFFSTVR